MDVDIGEMSRGVRTSIEERHIRPVCRRCIYYDRSEDVCKYEKITGVWIPASGCESYCKYKESEKYDGMAEDGKKPKPEKPKKPKKPKDNTKLCDKFCTGCMYHNRFEGSIFFCSYCAVNSESRGCPAGKGCTKYTSGDKKVTNFKDDRYQPGVT